VISQGAEKKEVMMTKKATHAESEKRVEELEQETF